ncbi:coiled-coil domain-containing protein 24 [Pelodytes ibericus]
MAKLQPISDHDSGFAELLEPPPSLWKLVGEQVPISERAEIKRILGDAAVDLSLDLHAEVEVLLDLWRDLRSSFSSSRQTSPQSLSSLLADPPVIKDMVTQEIRMLLLSIRQKALHDGLDEVQALSKYNPKVVRYVLGESRPDRRTSSAIPTLDFGENRSHSAVSQGLSRPQTGSSGRDARPWSSLSPGSCIEGDLEELKDKLKISDIDEVVMHLKSLLEVECHTLQSDITFLQQRLELEHLIGADSQTLLPGPSLSELKEERRVIEWDLQLRQTPASSQQSQTSISPKVTKTSRQLDGAVRTGSDKFYLKTSNKTPVSGDLSACESRVSPRLPNSNPKIQEKRKCSSQVTIKTTALQPPSVKVEQRADVRTCKRPSKSCSIGAVKVSGSPQDYQVPSLKVTSKIDLPEKTPFPPELGIPVQGHVPSPPQVQRPVGNTHSFSALRRVKIQPPIPPS